MDIEATAGGCLGRETVRRLSRRSDLQGLLQLALHAGLLCATGLIVWTSRDHPWLLGALVLHGIVLAFLFCPLHESIHRTAFASRWLNDVVAWICGALLMLPRSTSVCSISRIIASPRIRCAIRSWPRPPPRHFELTFGVYPVFRTGVIG